MVGRWTAKDPIGFGGGDSNFLDPSGLVPFGGGTPEQRAEAYRLQAQLRDSLSPATRALFWFSYGEDLYDALSPCGGPEVQLKDLSYNGKYQGGPNSIEIDTDLLTGDSPTTFQATLLHELAHWGGDMARPFGEAHPAMAPAFESQIRALREASRSSASKAKPGDHPLQPYGFEYVQFGSLPSLEGWR